MDTFCNGFMEMLKLKSDISSLYASKTICDTFCYVFKKILRYLKGRAAKNKTLNSNNQNNNNVKIWFRVSSYQVE